MIEPLCLRAVVILAMSPLPNTKPEQQVPATRMMAAKAAMSPAQLEDLLRRGSEQSVRRYSAMTAAERQHRSLQSKEWRKDQRIITGTKRTNVLEPHDVRVFLQQNAKQVNTACLLSMLTMKCLCA
jgi:hypothetical protein